LSKPKSSLSCNRTLQLNVRIERFGVNDVLFLSMPRRKLLCITQTSMMLLAFFLAVLTFLKVVKPWHILLLALGLGIANAFDAPARQAFVPEMVDREDLANAIALNSIMFNLGTVLGPAAAGVIYALFGPAWCFVLNGLTYIAIIVALVMMSLKPFTARTQLSSPLDDLKEGLRYVASQDFIFGLIPLGALLAGWVAEALGEPLTILLSGIMSLPFAIWVFLAVPKLRALSI
jgi:MFS family permease